MGLGLKQMYQLHFTASNNNSHFKMNFTLKVAVILAVLALVLAEEKTAEEQTLVLVADQDMAAHHYGTWRGYGHGYGHGWGYGRGYYNPYGHSGWSYRHRRSADDSTDQDTDASHYGRYGGYGGHYGGYYGGHRGGYYGGHRGYGFGGYRHYY